MAAALNIIERRIGPVTLLELDGSLVVDDGDRLFRDTVDLLVASGNLDLVVDLSRVTAMDSGGVGVLVAKYLHVTKRGGRLKLLRPSSRASRVLRISRLLPVFEVYDNEEDALRSFQVAPDISASGADRQTPASVPEQSREPQLNHS